MSARSLDPLFAPRSVAVVGASSTEGKVGALPITYLRTHGFQGRIVPINPKADQVQGLPAFPSLRSVGEPVDLVVFAIPEAALDAALDDAIAAGARAAIVFSAGFAEVGAAGEAGQRRLTERARGAGLRVIGPNCLGVMNLRNGMFGTFTPVAGFVKPPVGHVGLVSQSGAFGAYAYVLAARRGLGLSLWASTGNEADVEIADVIDWMVDDPATSVIMAYVEGCRDGDRMRRALAAAHAARKPVVVVKVGRTALGAQAARSHTASLAGDDAAYDAMFRQYGVYRARDVEDFFNVAHGASIAGLPRNDRVALFTLSGGVGAFMADEAAQAGLDAAEMPADDQRAITDLVPFAAPRNPIDITGQVTNDRTLVDRAARIILGSSADYGTWIGFMAAGGASPAFWGWFEPYVTGWRRDFPDRLMVVSTLFRPEAREGLTALGCLTYDEPADAVRTVAALARLRAAQSEPVPPPLSALPAPTLRLASGALDEPASLALLAAHGVPTVPHRVVRSAAEAAAEPGGPFAVKVVSADILHKTDVGGVRLGVPGGEAAAHAFEAVTGAARHAQPQARIDGAMLAPMVGGGVECILGVRNDPTFGPVLMFGLGGAFVEVLRDVSFALAPLTRAEAQRMVRSVRAFPLLDGARGRPRCDLSAVVDALLALSALALAARDTLDGIDVNPFVVFPPGGGPGGASAVALDAVVLGRAGD
jgi:acyl-CoA synthetase (NDP forming)